jgi:hypothetical protein
MEMKQMMGILLAMGEGMKTTHEKAHANIKSTQEMRTNQAKADNLKEITA